MVKYSLNQLYLGSKIFNYSSVDFLRCVFIPSQSTRNVFTENLELATATDIYILRGDRLSEIYEPTYNFQEYANR